MQEEKNNQNKAAEGKDKGHRPPRRHGYFIEQPTANSTEDAKARKPQGNPQRQSKPKGEQKSENTNQQKPHHHRNDRRKPFSEHKPNEPKQEEQKPQEQNQKSGGGADNKPVEGAKKKNNRKKNRNKNKNNEQKPNEAEVNQQKPAPASSDKGRQRTLTRDAKPLPDHSSDDYEEYKLVVEEVTEAPKEKQTDAEDDNAPKTEVVGIRFKSSGKVYYFSPNGRTFKKGSNAIVDTARGQEFGEVAMSNTFVKTSDIVPPLRTVIRSATTADVEHHKANKQKEDDAFKLCNEKIAAHKLDMKLIDAQYTFDNSKLLFYFTSSDRVDFRELVKDLASVFRTRIELRQIGIRDEAKLMGGLGMCGRPLCCTLFLSDFDQVSIKMAKEQNLSLNSAKISGICGRLMCCLKYEHEAYEYEIKRTPPVDSLVRTENGDGIVTEISPLKGTVKVRLLASPEVPPKSYKRDEVTMLRKKQATDKKQDK